MREIHAHARTSTKQQGVIKMYDLKNPCDGVQGFWNRRRSVYKEYMYMLHFRITEFIELVYMLK